jgi:hypothetical protein
MERPQQFFSVDFVGVPYALAAGKRIFSYEAKNSREANVSSTSQQQIRMRFFVPRSRPSFL